VKNNAQGRRGIQSYPPLQQQLLGNQQPNVFHVLFQGKFVEVYNNSKQERSTHSKAMATYELCLPKSTDLHVHCTTKFLSILTKQSSCPLLEIGRIYDFGARRQQLRSLQSHLKKQRHNIYTKDIGFLMSSIGRVHDRCQSGSTDGCYLRTQKKVKELRVLPFYTDCKVHTHSFLYL
jgi:hypothetical protein